MISGCFQGKPFNITVIQVCAPTTDTEEAEVDQLCEDLQYLLELTPKNDMLFITGAKMQKYEVKRYLESQASLALECKNEAGQRLTEFYQENSLVIGNTLFQQLKRFLYIWTSPDGQY